MQYLELIDHEGKPVTIRVLDTDTVRRQAMEYAWDLCVQHIADKHGYGWQREMYADNPFRLNKQEKGS